MGPHESRKNKLFELLNNQLESQNHKNKSAIITKPENIFYFTDFWGEGILLISDYPYTKLIVPKLEYARAINTSKNCEIVPSERGTTIIDKLIELSDGADLIYSDSNDYNMISKVIEKLGSNNVIVNDNIFYKLREIKEKEEIEKIQKASKIIDRLFEISSKEIKENVTEEEIQSILVYEAMKLGARFPSYSYTTNPLIIASGHNGSFPHAETSSKKIKQGEFVVLDITLSLDHYVSDATRTFGIGKITKEMMEIYEIVKTSQENGIEQLKHTKNFAEIDAACRNTIAKKKFGEHFIHSTGHGIGLEVHEPPWIRPNVESLIKENMSITIEPGIYLQNKLGVRIEDSLLITKKKNENEVNSFVNFNSFTKELLIL